ncbi:hypothetical protein [Pseudoduganella lutea]|uniref:Uncharacterized protein n=1 Tax=Pseudoduganella lutea TaxID=321985 RepID=A0A4P6L661_9BURK|nr:hypothetical protein [Pseudoduganella lutea]QBE66845.1 hypothetical protein EWM63_30955 [Pseudoduganella lutea]
MKQPFPLVPKVLLESLENHFRDTVPNNPETTLEDFKLLQGQLSVVRFLRKQYDDQTKNILEN